MNAAINRLKEEIELSKRRLSEFDQEIENLDRQYREAKSGINNSRSLHEKLIENAENLIQRINQKYQPPEDPEPEDSAQM